MTVENADAGRLVAGRYRLAEPIGSGGMGTVWRAHDEVLRVDVAVKEVHVGGNLADAERAEHVAAALREARNAARLRANPHVVTVHDTVEHDGLPWIVMELVAASTLAAAVDRDGPVPVAQAIRIGLAVLDALVAGQRLGVLHRDVKPSNILLAADGRVLLTDFGIAAHVSDPTRTDHGVDIGGGTPAYMAPERLVGGPATLAGDLFALGATLYFAVEGFSLFQRESLPLTIGAVLHASRPTFARAGEFGKVIEAFLAKSPASRLNADGAQALLSWAAARASSSTAARRPPSPPPPPAPPDLSDLSGLAGLPVPVPPAPAGASAGVAASSDLPVPSVPLVPPGVSGESGESARSPSAAGAGAAASPGRRPPATAHGPVGRGHPAPADAVIRRRRAARPASSGHPWPAGSAGARPTSASLRARTPRRLALLAVTAAVLLGGVAGGTYWLVTPDRGPAPRPGALPSPIPSDRADTLPPGMVGSWSGTVTQGPDRFEADLVLRAGRIGQVVGTSGYPQDGCAGELTLQAATARTARLSERLTPTSVLCFAATHVDLTVQDDGTLTYTYPATPISSVGTAVLRRSTPPS